MTTVNIVYTSDTSNKQFLKERKYSQPVEKGIQYNNTGCATKNFRAYPGNFTVIKLTP